MKAIINCFHRLKLNRKFTVAIAVMVLLPVIVLSDRLFYTMEENVIGEKQNAMNFKQGKSHDQIIKNVESINMSTQFFLSDQALRDFLVANKKGESFSTQELMELNSKTIASLERMINNNPYLYQIHVYAEGNQIQEMMPVLYRYDRMKKLAWAFDHSLEGWKFNYEDELFSLSGGGDEFRVMSLLTPIDDFREGRLGILEAAMRMDTMFPSLFDSTQKEWSCFIDAGGKAYWGDEPYDGAEQIVEQILLDENNSVEQKVYFARIGGKSLIIGYHPVKELDGLLIGVQDIGSDLAVIYRQRGWFIFALFMVMFLLTAVINRIVKRLLKQFYGILQSIREIQKGDLQVVIANCGTDEMGELGCQINKMMERIKKLMEDNLNHEILVKNTQIRALQNQINAHFIYNVLESVKMMAEIDEKYEISDAITSLGKLLRYSMRWTSGNATVAEELEYIKDYLKLINLRFDYEIYLSLNIPEEMLPQQIPKMSLQPIVENAIYHGIEQMAEDTNIYVKGIVEGEDCIIEITDAGRGMSDDEVLRLYQKMRGEIETSGGGAGNGIGLKNVQDRIRMCFGSPYGIEINAKLGCYTKVKVRIPQRY